MLSPEGWQNSQVSDTVPGQALHGTLPELKPLAAIARAVHSLWNYCSLNHSLTDSPRKAKWIHSVYVLFISLLLANYLKPFSLFPSVSPAVPKPLRLQNVLAHPTRLRGRGTNTFSKRIPLFGNYGDPKLSPGAPNPSELFSHTMQMNLKACISILTQRTLYSASYLSQLVVFRKADCNDIYEPASRGIETYQ